MAPVRQPDNPCLVYRTGALVVTVPQPMNGFKTMTELPPAVQRLKPRPVMALAGHALLCNAVRGFYPSGIDGLFVGPN